MSEVMNVPLDKRFQFGKNWKRLLGRVSESHIREAEKSLQEMLGLDDLKGKRFLDVGSGSGLFSLAARRLGATVHSFDYDPNSVQCTKKLKALYFSEDSKWTIESGSVLDAEYIRALGSFDIVYSWGVLHHTGDMWKAFENLEYLVSDSGRLFISIYNDQQAMSVFWRYVKGFYCSGWFGKILSIMFYFPYSFFVGLVADTLRLKNPTLRYTEYKKLRGMSKWIDWIDWLGGYPFEVAKPEAVFDFFKERGFQLQRLRTCGGGLACNEFVFLKLSRDRT